MTWLITGGCGFLGCNLADACLDRGDNVVILDNLSMLGSRQNLAWLREHHGTEWAFVDGDIRDSQGLVKLVKEHKPKVVAHLAGQVAMTTSLQNPRLDFEVNAVGTFNLLEAVRQHAQDAVVIYASTNKVYGDLDWVCSKENETRYIVPDYPNGFDETLPLDFHSPYGCSKGSADQYMLDYARMFGLRTVVFRHSSMYGGRQFATFDQGWVSWFCQKALEAKEAQSTLHGSSSPAFTISGNGKQVRDILHIDDIKWLYWLAAERADQASGQAFNIGGGIINSLSLLELFQVLNSVLGVSLQYEQLPTRKSDQKVFVADVSKATKLLRWEPAVTAREGLCDVLRWLRGDRPDAS